MKAFSRCHVTESLTNHVISLLIVMSLMSGEWEKGNWMTGVGSGLGCEKACFLYMFGNEGHGLNVAVAERMSLLNFSNHAEYLDNNQNPSHSGMGITGKDLFERHNTSSSL
ncbi:uncharacterized protein CLUP02_04074 [Colletotrichum lupini]|uniref:Uncharacterized protein n=1 Tax=Colletotrichum lupini TaxID=145971 RepID=A0A9Q8SJL7_9PEZI|nr:uncharacterized protein CLUP02_04074 [Colletotrichum lupini]UQC78597.1 hypothetical protein CLUP02_04074 [Colletotrichum lupini]